MSLIIIKLDPQGILNILLVVVICSAFYTMVMFLFKGISRKEVQVFMKS
jgi:Flp pilus assembly protein protease CpaA